MRQSHDLIDLLLDIFDFIDEQKVDAFCYIDSNWDSLPMYKNWNWGDGRVEKNEEIKEFWLTNINRDRYLKASKDLFAVLGSK